ncbi:MAG: ATP-binding protein [Christensenellales bacterium]
MSVRSTAEKIILKRKLEAEELADRNLNNVLKDENIKILFVKCKQLVVQIAKLEVDGKSAKAERKMYNDNRLLLAKLLKSMGIDKSELKPKYSCPICKDTGYVKGRECVCLKKEMSLELIRRSGIDVSSMATFNDDFLVFDEPDKVKCIYNKMRKYVEQVPNNTIDTILIMGDTGVGKTHLMECMATYAIEKGNRIKYVSAFNFNQEMLKYHCAKLEDKGEILEDYLSCEMLFIDDLGTENKINNVTNEYLYSVLNDRMQNHRSTIITTNLDFAQIQENYGERIFSRLAHKKQSLKINLTGSDLRLKK